MSFDGPPLGVHANAGGPIPEPGQAEYEATWDELKYEIHRIMDQMGSLDWGYPEEDNDKWRKAAEQAIWWHPDVNEISSEFDTEAMIDQITEEW